MIKGFSLLDRPMPSRKYNGLAAIEEARLKEIVNIDALYEVLEEFHMQVEGYNSMSGTRFRTWHNAKTNVQPFNVYIGDYALVRIHAKCEHKWQAQWRGIMFVKEAKSNLVFLAQGLMNAKKQTVNVQRIIPYPILRKLAAASEESRLQVADFDTAFHTIHEIKEIKTSRRKLQVWVKCARLEDKAKHTWESLRIIREGIPGILEDFLHAAVKFSIERTALYFYF